MNTRPSPAERVHLARVKALACSVCDAPPPSQAHHISQRSAWTCVALCPECHQGTEGWHGTRALWNVRKLDQLGALAITIRRLMT
ncbi:MAG: hypothetical protein KBA18_10700 [Kiritimatiellae bacterium]|nr:hypothetical protein [Kiritimatiellia bacterium]